MITSILTDIEGTTSSLSFVKDVLFPHAAAHLPDFVRTHRNDPEVARLLADARLAAAGIDDEEALIAQLLEWIATDRKITPLKALQGLIWEEGYARGDFAGHIYPDAARCLRDWHAAGIQLYVYSSGSVHAQRLLFGHTAHGDLTPLFSGFFDTRIGAKREPDAYRAIATAIGRPPSEILFLSDVREELDAARAAGLATTALRREGIAGSFGEHPVVEDFTAIDLGRA
ncbi:MAG: acireductone synthase [Sphingobacteriia bacterium]|nr:acireductone synthase [Sphingobacteriia bacterium]NCC39945.1 acireductone synthase [Gammaproteobacteria bacterium]